MKQEKKHLDGASLILHVMRVIDLSLSVSFSFLCALALFLTIVTFNDNT